MKNTDDDFSVKISEEFIDPVTLSEADLEMAATSTKESYLVVIIL